MSRVGGRTKKDSATMPQHAFDQGRFFLKDLIRLQVDFSNTDQSRKQAAPPLQKPCDPDIPRIALPDGKSCLERLCVVSLGEAIARRKSVRSYSTKALSMEELSMLLWATQGVRKVTGDNSAFRTVPSAGARHAFETYLVVSRVDSLEPGLYRYLPFDNQLLRLSGEADLEQRAALACYGQDFVGRAAVTFFWTTIPARSEWRYGHVCQNLYLAAGGIGAGVCAVAAYNQEACDTLLEVDGTEEFTIYAAAVGKCRDKA
jgi:SagB-type dehydrogenase family enzyme